MSQRFNVSCREKPSQASCSLKGIDRGLRQGADRSTPRRQRHGVQRRSTPRNRRSWPEDCLARAVGEKRSGKGRLESDGFELR